MAKTRASTNKPSGMCRLREKIKQIRLARTLTEAACLADVCLALLDEIEAGPKPRKPEPKPSPRCACGCRKVANICILGRWWYSQDHYRRKLGWL